MIPSEAHAYKLNTFTLSRMTFFSHGLNTDETQI